MASKDWIVVYIVIVASANGCTAKTDPQESFLHIEQLIQAKNWEEVEWPLKDFLITHPDHPGGHLLLAQFYLRWDDPWPFVADGELNMARRLFREQEGRAGLSLTSDEEFEGLCSIQAAIVPLRRVQIGHKQGLNPAVLFPHIESFRERLAEAKTVAADSKRLQDLEAQLRLFSDFMNNMGAAASGSTRENSLP